MIVSTLQKWNVLCIGKDEFSMLTVAKTLKESPFVGMPLVHFWFQPSGFSNDSAKDSGCHYNFGDNIADKTLTFWLIIMTK